MKDKENFDAENLQVQRVRSFTGLGKGEPQDDQVMYGGEGVEKLAAKLVATQDALEAMCMEKESQKLFYEERLQSVEAERDQLRDDKDVLEQSSNELQETLDELQDEAETNKAVLMSRIEFLSNELQELDSDSREAVTQLNRQVSAVSTALDRVIIERDHACQELIHAAREKVTALVNYSELSTLIHTCLTKKSPQGVLVDENGATHDEILRKYEQAIAENTTLRLQLQDAGTTIEELRQDLETTVQARDIEHERSEMLAEIVEEREEECAQIASAAEDKQQTVTELQETLESMELQEESRAHDVDEMALHLLTLREKLDNMQSEAEEQDEVNAESEEETMREMHKERLSLLERQMHLITELAASEFTILSLTEELEEAHTTANMLQEENAMLMTECGMLDDHANQRWDNGASTSRSAPPEITYEGYEASLPSAPSATGIEDEEIYGEIQQSPSPVSIACVEDVMTSLQGQASLSQAGILSGENLPNTHNCAVDQELRGHLKSTKNGAGDPAASALAQMISAGP